MKTFSDIVLKSCDPKAPSEPVSHTNLLNPTSVPTKGIESQNPRSSDSLRSLHFQIEPKHNHRISKPKRTESLTTAFSGNSNLQSAFLKNNTFIDKLQTGDVVEEYDIERMKTKRKNEDRRVNKRRERKMKATRMLLLWMKRRARCFKKLKVLVRKWVHKSRASKTA